MKAILALCALICVVNAASIKWTGLAQNNQWTSTVNWYPAQVPGPNDDVTIETGDVQVTISTGVNSLTMGTSVNGFANLTIFQSFVVAQTLDVDINGNLFLNAGTASLQGNVKVQGHLYFQSGTVGGDITITSKGTADLSGAATKNLIGAGFTNNGNAILSGTVGFNQSSVFTNAGTVTAEGDTQLSAGDSTPTLFDSSSGSFSYNGGNGNTLRVMVHAKFQSISLISGDVSFMDRVSIANDILVPSGSTIWTQANGNTTFSGTLHGDGNLNTGGLLTTLNTVNLTTVTVTVGYAYFNGPVIAGSLIVNAGTTTFSNTSEVDKFSITSGNIQFDGQVNANWVVVQGGVLTGAGGFSASNTASFASQGINLGTTFTLSGEMTFSSKTLIAYATGGNIVINSGANVSISSPLTLTGAPGSGSFTNNGAVFVSSALSSANIDLLGSGSYSVSGTITTSSCAFNANLITVDNGTVSGLTTALGINTLDGPSPTSEVSIAVGSYSFSCVGSCKNIKSTKAGQKYSFTA